MTTLQAQIKEFIEAQSAAKKAADRELTLRNKLFKDLVAANVVKASGSTTKRDFGYKIEATAKTNITIYEAGLDGVRAGLIEAFGEAKGNEYFDITFPSKITYSATGHKNLPEEQRELVNDALIAKPATPTLKFTVEETDAD